MKRHDMILIALRDYRCTQQQDDDLRGLLLADALTPNEAPSIKFGLKELDGLAVYLDDLIENAGQELAAYKQAVDELETGWGGDANYAHAVRSRVSELLAANT